MKSKMTMNSLRAITYARQWRAETITELQYLIQDLQRDLDRLTQAQNEGDTAYNGYSPHSGNNGYYLSQHCLRYEQAVKAGVKMEQYAKMADWIED